MAFFNEFPHTRTYDSDLAWLIERMKEILTRMDTLEEKMAALEALVNDFINTLDIDSAIRAEIQRLIDSGDFNKLLTTIMSYESATEEIPNLVSDLYTYGGGTPEHPTINQQHLKLQVVGTSLRIFTGGFEFANFADLDERYTDCGLSFLPSPGAGNIHSILTLNEEAINNWLSQFGLALAIKKETQEINYGTALARLRYVNTDTGLFVSYRTATALIGTTDQRGLYIRGFFNSSQFGTGGGSSYSISVSYPYLLCFCGFSFTLPLKQT